MNIEFNITAYANGTLSSQSQQQIRSALEAKLGHGIRDPLFYKLVQESAEAVAKAVKAEAPRYLRIDQIHEAARPVSAGPCYMRITKTKSA